MSSLSDLRALFVKEAVEDEEGDSFAAMQQAQRKYQEYVQRDLTTGEYEDIHTLTNRYSKEFKEERKRRDAERYRELKG